MKKSKYCNGVTPVPRGDTALQPEFGGTRPGMPRGYVPSPVPTLSRLCL